jgi:DNA invertase Pin-like site-specific DNA recombinase
MRVALYCRTSTREQHTENQLLQLRQHAALKGWTITREYTDQESGARPTRAGLARLFKDAEARLFDAVLVWSLDRFTRKGILDTFTLLERLRNHQVAFVSATEEYFTTAGPAGEAFIAIAAWTARQERERIRARITAGMERAKTQGKRFGRPRATTPPANGTTVQALTQATGISRATAYRRLAESRPEGPRMMKSATFRTPRGAMNPLDLAMPGDYTVVTWKERGRFHARIEYDQHPGADTSTPLPTGPCHSEEAVQQAVAALFTEQLSPWQSVHRRQAQEQPAPSQQTLGESNA